MLISLITLVSCGSDDEPKYPDQKMTVGDVYKIPDGSTGWTSDNVLIASVSSNGVKAERVGETIIRNGSNSFKVTVTGKYNTYQIPCLQFGANKSTVKGFMGGYTLRSEDDDVIIYDGKHPVSFVGYSFTNNELKTSGVFIPISAVDTEELSNFLNERYIYVTKDDKENYIGFVSPDKKTIILVQAKPLNSQPFWVIMYGKMSDSSSMPAHAAKMTQRPFGQISAESNTEAIEQFSQLQSRMENLK